MLISIIIPVYNVEKYLKECVDSVLAQTYKNIEVILVDDGSTDGSGEICDEYKKNNSCITVIHKKNEGLGFARNTGLEYVHGEYVTFLDSDDYIDNDLIETLYENIDNNYDFIKSGFVRVNDNYDKFACISYANQDYDENSAKSLLLPRMIGSLPEKKDSIEKCVCAVLYKTSIIKEHNILFPSEREFISEDLIFNFDFINNSSNCKTIDYVGYNYRYNINSLTKKYREDRFNACKKFYLHVKNKLNLNNYNEEVYYRLSKMFFIYIRMCLHQEKILISQNKKNIAKNNIATICDDELVNSTITSYPIKRLGFKQHFFLHLIKKRKIILIYLLIKINII